MFGRRIHLFTVFGFEISADASWGILAVLVTWSLATRVFPFWYDGLGALTYWSMGVVGALGLFASIVLHELSHSLIARTHGVMMRGITLFIFGGVAEMADEPPNPKAEFQVAVAGPLASILVSVTCLGLYQLGVSLFWPVAIGGVLKYLAFINGVLVLFNMIPAFPLDGGRVLRSVLWHWKKNLIWATHITSRIGIGFAWLLIAFGIVRAAILHDVQGGIWSALIGLFLYGAASNSYRQLLVRSSFEGLSIRDLMQVDPVTVPAQISVASLVEDYVRRYDQAVFPVTEGETLIGCINALHLKELDRDQWPNHSARELAVPCSDENSIHPDDPAMKALATMTQFRTSRLLVVENGQLVGAITLNALRVHLRS